jgi:hypothetical protein
MMLWCLGQQLRGGPLILTWFSCRVQAHTAWEQLHAALLLHDSSYLRLPPPPWMSSSSLPALRGIRLCRASDGVTSKGAPSLLPHAPCVSALHHGIAREPCLHHECIAPVIDGSIMEGKLLSGQSHGLHRNQEAPGWMAAV